MQVGQGPIAIAVASVPGPGAPPQQAGNPGAAAGPGGTGAGAATGTGGAAASVAATGGAQAGGPGIVPQELPNTGAAAVTPAEPVAPPYARTSLIVLAIGAFTGAALLLLSTKKRLI